jgi:opacity protein-like surface antigen
MKRLAWIAVVCLVATLGPGARPARAQAAPGGPGPDSKFYAEFNFGPTLGHHSDLFVGGEGGMKLTDTIDVFVEGGHMGNVGTSDLDERATTIANHLGGTASSAFKVNYFDGGIRYNIDATPNIHPYVMGGLGVAHVTTEVAFTVNGVVIDPAPGVQLGSDLSGGLNKVMLVIGFGVRVPFKTRFFGDLGYRYSPIFKSDSFETDSTIPTQRIVLGAGIRF